MTKHTLTSLCNALNVDAGSFFSPGEISGVATDSREVGKGGVFVAIKGEKSDGNDFVTQAVRQGASVIISETPSPGFLSEAQVVWIQVDNARKAAALAAEWYFGNPSRLLKLVGVTGTNGKSSNVWMLYQLFEELGFRVGMFSTIANMNHLVKMPARLTTPDPVALSRDMAGMVHSGCDFAFMEVSSHSLAQDRVSALDFDGAVFTNITHDHLDYHGTFQNYINTKKLFFDHLKPGAFALINEEDRHADYMVQNTRAMVRTFGLRSLADYTGQILDIGLDAMTVRLDNREIITRMTGRFNAYNLLSVYAVAIELGMSPDEVLPILSNLDSVPGRFQRLAGPGGGPLGVVDYAHTPDAIEQLTRTASEMVRDEGRLLIALGCGGNRDRDKRPVMARTAARNADIVILTSDNPRDEDPETIIAEMFDELEPPLKAKVFRITDRREAIRMAVSMANPEDVIIIAGKGHEQFQEIKGRKYPFDDYVELKNALNQKIEK